MGIRVKPETPEDRRRKAEEAAKRKAEREDAKREEKERREEQRRQHKAEVRRLGKLRDGALEKLNEASRERDDLRENLIETLANGGDVDPEAWPKLAALEQRTEVCEAAVMRANNNWQNARSNNPMLRY